MRLLHALFTQQVNIIVETVCEDAGKVFAECASPCPRTCADRNSALSCIETAPEDCTPTCVCPENMVEQDGNEH